MGRSVNCGSPRTQAGPAAAMRSRREQYRIEGLVYGGSRTQAGPAAATRSPLGAVPDGGRVRMGGVIMQTGERD